ncbi:MAG: uracil-DNA glycosylase [Alteromonadaceae bacterium]|jgi:uracil-DNA glycosylase|uniref:Uracil-DNA glycosylase n=1 Tax=Paraglaciecola mesophila KMM 241 TaxID=1128912 RepID=K6ZAP6_9ALTE|nr:uracil-DNA glycosylase [Paraglaciecola mesophila]MAD16457.1 uracil-DNA glycosylase [Alteromonadaceae bacterium]MBB19358.1 uracil-DNA glycosylase [Rickettsiales bacterium]GAC26048.1 uracil-DNA glycosylase [Paraglaciecola mesophila KMM 241]
MTQAATWQTLLGEEKRQAYFTHMMDFIASERASGKVIYPAAEDVFNAFSCTEFNQIKVVILGQDPYHGPNQAHGLSFSVQKGVKTPPSLKNMYKALQHDFPDYILPEHGCLQSWAEQGVFLLNTVLTVEQGKAHSHAKIGWERFSDKVIALINEHAQDVVFLLWGSHAQKKAGLIDTSKHHILTAAHPSPLSAYRGFFECGHFAQTNQILIDSGRTPINWQI